MAAPKKPATIPVAEQGCANCAWSRPSPRFEKTIECRRACVDFFPSRLSTDWCFYWSPVTEPRTLAERPAPVPAPVPTEAS